MLVEFAFIVAGLLVVAFASFKVVQVLNGVSLFMKIPKYLLAFLILGLGTSLPDMVIAGVSSAQGESNLVVGMIIGSNIIVLTIMLGLVTLIKGDFRVREKTVLENFGWIFFVLMIPLLLFIDGKLSFVDGILLLVVYAMYAYIVYTQEMAMRRPKEPGVQMELSLTDMPKEPRFYDKKRFFAFEFAKFVVFLVLLLASAEFVVENAKLFSVQAGIPPVLLGFSIIALGVTLPQLAIEVSALRAQEEEIIWGDIIGGFVTELTLVLGIAALFSGGSGLIVDLSQTLVGYVFMFLSFILVFFFTFTKKTLSKAEGLALLFLYFVFLVLQFDLLFLGAKPLIG